MYSSNSQSYDQSDRIIFENTLLIPIPGENEPQRHLFIIKNDELIGFKGERLDSGVLVSYPIRMAEIEVIHENSDGNFRYPSGLKLSLANAQKDVIRLYCLSELHVQAWFMKLKRYCLQKDFESHYVERSTIGEGKFSVIKLLEHHGDSKRKYAGKFINRAGLDETKEQLVKNEIAIGSMLQHELCVTFYEAFVSPERYVIVTEYLEGGILSERIFHRSKYSEKMAAQVLCQLIMALNYMHANGILHRDVKLENIFLAKQANDLQIKLGDFDLSNTIIRLEEKRVCGTAGYLAPELFDCKKQNYSTKSDIYAAGIVLYGMLFGALPYTAATSGEILDKNRMWDVCQNQCFICQVSGECSDLLKRMLDRDPEQRISGQDILLHPFLLKYKTLYVTIEQRMQPSKSPGEENANELETSEKNSIFEVLTPKVSDRELACKFIQKIPSQLSFDRVPRTTGGSFMESTSTLAQSGNRDSLHGEGHKELEDCIGPKKTIQTVLPNQILHSD